MSFILTKQLVH